MTIEFKLPDLGEGVASADVAGIHVAAGDSVTVDQNVLELETEKAVIDLPCPHAGQIVELRVKQGQTVKPGDVLMLLEPAGNGAPKQAASPAPQPEASSQSAPAAEASAAKPTSEPTATAPAGGTGTAEIRLPELGEGVDKADVASILVQVGDSLTAGQNILELETEKAVVDLPATQAGTVTEIHVKQGQTIKVGDLVVTLSGAAAGTPAPAPKTPASTPAATSAPAATSTVAAKPASAPAPATTKPAEPASDQTPAPAGPATRRLARELGVDLHRVKGSGKGGRITAEDVQAFVRELIANPASTGGGISSVAIPPLPDFTQFGEVVRKPMNKIARTSATNLSLAWQTIPHVTQFEMADVTELEAGRKRHSQMKGAAKITMTVLAIKAIVAALKQFPNFNASIDTTTNEIIEKQYYHIGVAVDTEQGLVVPVIKNANQKSILDIARELDTMAAKARDRKLSPSDFQGGTFTITNLGGIGGTMFTPIVNYPEVAILGMSRAKQQYVIVNGQPEIRLMLPLSLSYDHRVINGADAARFIVKVAGLLADPSQLLIES